MGYNYRVIVQGSSDATLNQVRRIAPDAFRTRINGQSVIQAGLFFARNDADNLERQLERQNLTVSILNVSQSSPDAVRQVPQTSTSDIPLPRINRGKPVVVLDPGHGGGDPGAIGIDGLREKDVVLPIAQQVAELLQRQGVQAVLTRQGDQEVELEPRVRLAEQLNATVFVSIHANSINLSRPDISGLETYYTSSAGQRLAQIIHASVLQGTGMTDRGVRYARFYVTRRTSMPATLVEIGFVTGREDAANLRDPNFRRRMAEAIARGILQYIQGN
jgi:N-acetylmuramoyl-L-alanine amidase